MGRLQAAGQAAGSRSACPGSIRLASNVRGAGASQHRLLAGGWFAQVFLPSLGLSYPAPAAGHAVSAGSRCRLAQAAWHAQHQSSYGGSNSRGPGRRSPLDTAAAAATASASCLGPEPYAHSSFPSLEELTANGCSLLPVAEPHSLLKPSQKWRLSQQIRKAIEDAISAGVNVALVRLPALQHQQYKQPLQQQHQQQQHQLDSLQYSEQQRQAAVATVAQPQQLHGTRAINATRSPAASAAEAADAEAPSIAVSYKSGDDSFLLLLQQAPRSAAAVAVVADSAQQYSTLAGPTVLDSQVDAQLAERRSSHASTSTSSSAFTSLPAAQAAGTPGILIPPTAAAAAAPLTVAGSAAAEVVQADLPAQVLTSLIRGCRDVQSVQALVEQHWEALDHIHVGAAFVQLARLKNGKAAGSRSRSQRQQQQEQQEWQRGHMLGATGGRGHTVAAANVCWEVTAVDSPAVSLLRPAGSISSSNILSWRGAPVLQQQRGQQQRQEQQQQQQGFLSSLLLLAEQQLERMQSRQVSNILWACAVLRLRPSDAWLQRFAGAIKAQLQHGTAPQGFANSLWALASMEYHPGDAWMRSFFSASAQLLPRFGAQELSSTLWSLATLRQRPPKWWLAPALESSAALMGACSTQALSNQAWALATLKLAPGPAWMTALAYASQQQARQFTPQGLSILLWSAASLQQGLEAGLGVPSPKPCPWVDAPLASAWLGTLEVAAEEKLGFYGPQALSNTLWALAAMGRRPNARFLAKFERAAAQQLADFTGPGIASSLWALAALEHVPQRALLQGCILRLKQQLVGSSPQTLASVATALHKLQTLAQQQQQQQQQQRSQMTPHVWQHGQQAWQEQQQPQQQQWPHDALVDDAWLQQYLCHSEPQLQRCRPSQLAAIGTALAGLGCAPPSHWQAQYLQAASMQLPDFLPAHFGSLLGAVGAWGATPHPGWTASFLAAARQQLGSFLVADVAALVQAMPLAGVRPGGQQLEVFLDRVLVLLEGQQQQQQQQQEGGCSAVLATFDVLVLLSFRPRTSWLNRYWHATTKQLRAWPTPHLATLLSQLARLQLRPPHKWASALHASCSAQLASLQPASAAELLCAAALLRRPPARALLLLYVGCAEQAVQQLQFEQLSKGLWGAAKLSAFAAAPVPVHPSSGGSRCPSSSTIVDDSNSTRSIGSAQAADAHHQTADATAAPAAADALPWLARLYSPDIAVALPSAAPANLAYTAEALALLGATPPAPWMQQLLSALTATSGGLDADSLLRLFSAVAAFATQGSPVVAGHMPGLTAALLQRAHELIPESDAAQLASLLPAVQVLGVAPGAPWLGSYLQAARAAVHDCSGQELAGMLAALARSDRAGVVLRRSFLEAALSAAVEKLPSTPAASLVELLWALQELNCKPSDAWLGRFEARILGLGFSAFSGAQLARLVVSLAALQHKPAQGWMAPFLVAAGEGLPELDEASLADMLWSCAMLDEKPGKQWLDSFQAESRAKLASFPTPSLVTTAWGLALLQHRPKQDWVDRYLAVVEGRLGGMGACQLAKLLWALAALDCHPGQAWMDAWRQQAELQLPSFDADALAEAMWALDKLDCSPGKTWVRRFAAEARARFIHPAGPMPQMMQLPQAWQKGRQGAQQQTHRSSSSSSSSRLTSGHSSSGSSSNSSRLTSSSSSRAVQGHKQETGMSPVRPTPQLPVQPLQMPQERLMGRSKAAHMSSDEP